jgi:hypothetical protein
MIKEMLEEAQAAGATPAQQKRAIIITLAAAIGLFLLFISSAKASDSETFWLIQRVSITTSAGVTGIPPGTKVTMIKDNGMNLTVTDGTNTFEVSRAVVTTDAAAAQQAASNDYSAQVALANAREKELTAMKKSQANDEKTRATAEQEKAKPRYRLQGIVKQKFQDALLLERPSIYGGQHLPEDMHLASDKAAGIRYAEPGYLYLIGYPDAQKLADDDPVDCVASDAGVRSVNGSTYHAYTFVSK